MANLDNNMPPLEIIESATDIVADQSVRFFNNFKKNTYCSEETAMQVTKQFVESLFLMSGLNSLGD